VALLSGTRRVHVLSRAAVPNSTILNQVYYRTPFGMVPHDLDVSGFSCPGGFKNLFNGKYSFQGRTPDGRAYYAFGQHHLFYDKECDGEHGKDNVVGRWIFQYADKQDIHTDRQEMISDLKCAHSATLIMSEHPQKYKKEKPDYDFSRRPGAIPPAIHAWHVWCGAHHGWTVQVLHIGRPGVHVQGAWQFVKTAMPKEKITLKHGKSRTTSDGGEWEVQGSLKATISGEEGILGFEKLSAEASAEVGGRFMHTWASEVQSSEEQEVEFELPESKGQALWQWVYTAKKGDTEGTVLTQQYAFTPSGTEQGRPKCFPGGSKDGYHYQECYHGWEIQ